ncbi:MAG: DUF4194 domain-containing protein [Rhodanobacter sp.]|jgi:hypothetical protein|nr:DUF4194 domain-containing protein [Rhodanobacter sp.]
MNWLPHDEAAFPDKESAPDTPQTHANTLFIGDSGELALETRRALVQLLAGPSLEGRRHSNLWPILVRDEALIRRRLADLFLELVIDRDMQVAFTRQADTGNLEVPILLRRSQLTFIDSILLLHLRQRLTQADAQGDRAVVSIGEIMEFLALYERAANTDRAGFNRRIQASVEKIKKHSILQKIRASEDRFEISPTLKLLFSAEEIQALTHLYQRMAAGEVAAHEGQPEDDQETEQ